MVGTISPVVYGPAGLSTWYRIMGIYTLSQIAGAAVSGLAIAGTGALIQTFEAWDTPGLVVPLAILAAVAGVRDLKLLRFRLPSRNWQVPQSWKRFPPGIMAACYGFGIGLGVLTRIPFASFYFVLLACASLGSLPLGVGLMAFHGTARAGTVALVARSQAFAPDPHERLDTIGHLAPLVGYLDGLALALVAGVLLGQAVPIHF